MADFLLEIGLEEVPARMIAGAEAELGSRVNDLLTRERLLAPEAKADHLLHAAPSGRAGRGRSGEAGRYRGAVDRPVVEGGLQGRRADARRAGLREKSRRGRCRAEKGDNAEGRVRGRDGEAAGPHGKRDSCGRIAEGSAGDLLGQEHVLARGQAGAVCAAGALGCGADGCGSRPAGDCRHRRRQCEPRPSRAARRSAGRHRSRQRTIQEALRAASVVVDVAERRQIIRKALDAATRTVPGARWREDEALVETVTHLTEWPTVILGDFEPEYLALPEEVLVTVMRDHQKYFAVEDANGKLAPHFLAVLNTQADAEGEAIIRHGNARVLRARFKDARFFWDFDQKTPLAQRVESLKNVTFQKELGSYYWKTEQNLAVASALAAEAQTDGAAFDRIGALQGR